MPPTEEQIAKVKRLVSGGLDMKAAIAKVKGESPRAVASDAAPTRLGSFATGAEQGLSAGFADEFKAAAKAVGIDPRIAMAAPGVALTMLPVAITHALLDKAPSAILDAYRKARDEERSRASTAEEANPKSYLGGQVAGGVAASAIPGAGAATLGRAAVLGAGYGAASALGESTADLAKGEVGKAIKDVVFGAGIGLGAGVAGYGAAKGVGAVIGKARGVKAGAEEIAGGVAAERGELSGIGLKQTIGSFEKRSNELQQSVSQVIGEKFRLRPSQATGSPAAALAESKAAQSPGTMLVAQRESTRQLRQAAKWLDTVVDGISSNPSKLGRSDVSREVSSAVDRHIGDLIAEQSQKAGPLFTAVNQSTGGKRIMPTDNTTAALREMIDEYDIVPGSKIAAQLKATLMKIEGGFGHHGQPIPGRATETGRLSVSDLQKLMATWGKAAHGDKTLIEGLGFREQRMVASKINKALSSDLDSAIDGIASSDAATSLISARAVWRAYAQEIDDVATNTINRILKIGEGDAPDTLMQKIMGSSPDQMSGVFRVLNKSAPDTARQLRAQMLDEILVKSGKPMRGAPISAELGIDKFQPGSALKMLSDAEPVLQAAYAGDARSLLKLKESMELLQRLSVGPGLKGSQTAPLLEQAMSEAAGRAPGGSAILRWVKLIGNNDEAMAIAATTPEGIDAVNKALRVAVGKDKVSDKAATAIMATLTRLGINVAQQGGE